MNDLSLMFDKHTYSPKFYLVSSLGAAAIILGAMLMTYVFWKLGVEQNIFIEHFSTSVLFTDGLEIAGSATPWALISINWLACKMGIRRWRKIMKKRFN